jgi:cathepsin C
MMKAAGIAILSLMTPLTVVNADIPVHCLHRQTVGVWNFKLGSNNNDDTLTCGHKLPDSVMTMVDKKVRYDTPNFNIDTNYKVTLSNPNIATDDNGNKGTWTMIYDEGFEVRINGKKFFTFFVYEPRVDDPSPDKNGDFFSICDETFSGWYHNDDNTGWGCYVGKRVEGTKEDVADIKISNDHVVQPGSLLDTSFSSTSSSFAINSLLRSSTTPNKRAAQQEQERILASYDDQRRNFDQSNEKKQFVTDTSFIEAVNNDRSSSWSAKHYGNKFESLTHKELRMMLGTPKYKKDPFPSQSFVQTLEKKLTPAQQLMTIAKLPKNFDWRQKPNIVTEVVSQGSCGSCYAIAMTDSITMRLRVATKGADQTLLSPQNVVSCSDYNQGCEGGYPYLVGKFGEDIGFVPSYCQHYTASDTACRVSISISISIFVVVVVVVVVVKMPDMHINRNVPISYFIYPSKNCVYIRSHARKINH